MTQNHTKSLRTRTLGDCCKKVTWLTWAVSLANDRTIYSTAIMPRIFPWCLMHPKSTLLWESEVDCTDIVLVVASFDSGTMWYMMDRLGTSYSQRHEAKSCNGCWTTRVISNVSNYRCHAHELLNLLKASFASDSIFHTCSKQNQDESMSSRSSRVHSFADFLLSAYVSANRFSRFRLNHEILIDSSILWSFCQLALLLRNAGRNQSVQAPQPTQGPGGTGAFVFFFGNIMTNHDIVSNHSLIYYIFYST